MALGARALDVRLLVLGRGLWLAVLGCAVGLLGSYVAGRFLAALLYRVEPVDAPTFVSVPVLLSLTALVASLLPATRATRVSPAVTLREE
jgi:ABC-type antimicrobial peptide transport system permease subunit